MFRDFLGNHARTGRRRRPRQCHWIRALPHAVPRPSARDVPGPLAARGQRHRNEQAPFASQGAEAAAALHLQRAGDHHKVGRTAVAEDAASGQRPAHRGGRRQGAPAPRHGARLTLLPRPARLPAGLHAPGRGCRTKAVLAPSSPTSPPGPSRPWRGTVRGVSGAVGPRTLPDCGRPTRLPAARGVIGGPLNGAVGGRARWFVESSIWLFVSNLD